MKWLVVAAAAFVAQEAGHSGPLDISTLKIGNPTTVAEIDLGKIKGELRRLSWSPDGSLFAIRTVDGDKPDDRVHFYVVSLAGGAVAAVDREPEWAGEYWSFKADRFAPGRPEVMITVEQKLENVKVGTGAGAAADRESNPLGGNNLNSPGNLERAASSQKQNVVSLMLYGEAISRFVNTRPLPGLDFSWGPEDTGAVAFVDPDGRLFLLDGEKHKRAVAGAKAATLPAWTTDGTKIAYLQRASRKKYTLVYVTLAP